jgi:hypothetical protein
MSAARPCRQVAGVADLVLYSSGICTYSTLPSRQHSGLFGHTNSLTRSFVRHNTWLYSASLNSFV